MSLCINSFCYGHELDNTNLPDWVLIYFLQESTDLFKCNICTNVINVTEKCLELLHHIQEAHKEVYDLHKNSFDSGVCYQIEFLEYNKDEEVNDSPPYTIKEVICGSGKEDDIKIEDVTNPKFLLIPKTKQLLKVQERKKGFDFQRRRSWIWKYFDQITKTIYRCSLCNVVLSIKTNNSNNMNRHIRTKHLSIYNSELETLSGTTVTRCRNSEAIDQNRTEIERGERTRVTRPRRSWVWRHFDRITKTKAKCKLCKRIISHGGNATGNMNRHLKVVHDKSPDGCEDHWAWKVFELADGVPTCKICQYEAIKEDNRDHSLLNVLEHLKHEHGVVSSSQIITSFDNL